MRARISVDMPTSHTGANVEYGPTGAVVMGWQPGNGSRYDVSFAKRAGGGWIGVWDGAWIVFKLYFGARGASIEVVACPPDSELSKPDREALIALCTALQVSEVLS